MKTPSLFLILSITVALLVLAVVSSASATASTKNLSPYLTGCKPEAPDLPRRIGTGVQRILVKPKVQAILPARVKNVRHLPVVRGQMLASCGAYSPTYYYKTYQEAREHGWIRPDPEKNPERIMSPGFTFPLSNGGRNEGANIGHVMEIICRYGCADWKTMPESADYISYPSEAAWRNALPYRGKQVLYFDLSSDSGIAAFKEHLAGGDLGVIAALLYYDTYQNYGSGESVGVDSASGVIYDHGTETWDFHAFTIVGYDDDKAYQVGGETRKGAFLGVNSWGPGWGVVDPDAGSGGFVWFSYDYIKTKRGSLAGGAYAMVDRLGYQPVDLAVLDMNIWRRRYLSMGIYPGSPQNMLAQAIEAFPNGGGDHGFAGRIVLDITEFATSSPLCYTLSAYDVSNYFGASDGLKTGGITGLSIEKPGERIRSQASALEPVSILAGKVVTAHAGMLLPVSCGLDDKSTLAMRAAWGDWNRDGRPDLAAAGGILLASEGIWTYRNIEIKEGILQDLQSPTTAPAITSSRIAWGDYDNDGFPDLAVGGMVDFAPAFKLFRNEKTGAFAASGIALPAIAPSGLAWGDMNNDGRLDLLVAGADSSGSPVARLLWNDGAGKFTDSGLSLPRILGAAISVADMNNDGWLDLAVGNRVLRNNGKAGGFTAVATLSEGTESSHAWGDYNGDGLLDLAYSRFNVNADPAQRVRTFLYRNNGNFSFSAVAAGFAGVWGGSLAWADFDNDGRLDFALAGYADEGWTSKTVRLYRQGAGFAFRDTGSDLHPVAAGSLAWADFNLDGAVDLLLTGHTLDLPDVGMFQGATRFYANMAARSDGMARPNLPPSAPQGLRVEWDSAQQLLRLLWSDSSDTKTPAKSLGYRVRVGSWPGASNILSPHGDLNLMGPHAQGRISASQPGRLIAGLKPGRYYWTAQAIDGAMASSPWAPEQSFVLGPQGLVTGDANRDGRLDVADVVSARLMAQGAKTPQLAYADMDGNGKVEALDAWIIAQNLALSPGEPPLQLAEKTIGSAGGTLGSTSQGGQLIIPPESFGAAKSVRLALSARGSGPETVPMSWQVSSLPVDYKLPLQLRIPDLREDTSSTPFVMIQVPGFSSTLATSTTAFVKRQATKISGGWLEVTLDAPGALTAAESQELKAPLARTNIAASSPDVSTTLANYDYTLVIYLLSASQWRYDGGHFRIVSPLAYKSVLPAIAQDLEDAYAYYTNTLGFDLSRRDWTKSPMEVSVMDLGTGDTGEPVNGYTVSSMSYNGISLQVNQRIVTEPTTRRTTLAHEFFHSVQGLYDSRNRLARATTDPNLWLNEATATFLELHFAGAAPYFPDVWKAYKYMIFDGYQQAERFFGKTAQNYGYAMASLIHNMVQSNGGDPKIIHSIYQKVRSGKKGLYAAQESAPQWPLDTWITSLFENFVAEKGHPQLNITTGLLKNDLVGKGRTVTLKTEYHRGFSFPAAMLMDLGCYLSYIMFDDPLLKVQPEDKLGIQIKTDGPNQIQASLLLQEYVNGKRSIRSLGSALYNDDYRSLRLVLPNASAYVKKNSWLIPVVVNVDDQIYYDTEIESKLSFGVFQDYPNRPILEHTHELGHVYFGGDDVGWPAIKQSGSFSAYDVTFLREGYKDRGEANVIPGIQMRMWSEPSKPVPFNFVAELTSAAGEKVLPDGVTRVVCTYVGPTQYKMNKIRCKLLGPGNLSMELVEEGTWKDTGSYEMTLDDGEEMMMYDIDVRFNYNLKAYDLGNGSLLTDYTGFRHSSAFYVDLIRN